MALQAVLSSSATHEPVLDLQERLRALGAPLPRLHQELLAASDGLMAYDGYFRLFGVSGVVTDLALWNQRDTWKFAWPSLAEDFLCFGETGWGDQYAYRLSELESEAAASVYYLDAFSLQTRKLAKNFAAFLESDFLRNAKDPYDEFLVAARRKLGALESSEHITYVPSILVTGEESVEHICKMPARASMIANGDMDRQLSEEAQSRPIAGIMPFVDEQGRMRLEVLWA